MDTRPILQYSDSTHAVRLSRAGQADLVADSLLAGFQTERMRTELTFAVRAMSALLRDVGAFQRERIVGARLASEPIKGVLDDIPGALDHFSSMQIAGLGTRRTGTCGTGTAGLGHALQGQRDWDMRN